MTHLQQIRNVGWRERRFAGRQRGPDRQNLVGGTVMSGLGLDEPVDESGFR